ncbi:ABC transporter permease subunit, partial [Acinetobacter baumannii]
IPRELIEAARLDGCGDWGVFVRVVLPLSRSICAVVVILTVNVMWSEFIWSLLLLAEADLYTVMVKIYKMTSSYGGFSIDEQMVALSVAII